MRSKSDRSSLYLEEALTEILEDHSRAQAKDSTVRTGKKTMKKSEGPMSRPSHATLNPSDEIAAAQHYAMEESFVHDLDATQKKRRNHPSPLVMSEDETLPGKTHKTKKVHCAQEKEAIEDFGGKVEKPKTASDGRKTEKKQSSEPNVAVEEEEVPVKEVSKNRRRAPRED